MVARSKAVHRLYRWKLAGYEYDYRVFCRPYPAFMRCRAALSVLVELLRLGYKAFMRR